MWAGFYGLVIQVPQSSSTVIMKWVCSICFMTFWKKENLCVPCQESRGPASQTYTAEELCGQSQVVVQGQECHPLQPHHDDLQAGNKSNSNRFCILPHSFWHLDTIMHQSTWKHSLKYRLYPKLKFLFSSFFFFFETETDSNDLPMTSQSFDDTRIQSLTPKHQILFALK